MGCKTTVPGVMGLALAVVATGCSWFVQPSLPTAPGQPWSVAPISYHLDNGLAQPVGDQYWCIEPDPGDTWMVIRVRITNLSDRTRSISSHEDGFAYWWDTPDPTKAPAAIGDQGRNFSFYLPGAYDVEYQPKVPRDAYLFFKASYYWLPWLPTGPMRGELRFKGGDFGENKGISFSVSLEGVEEAQPPIPEPPTENRCSRESP